MKILMFTDVYFPRAGGISTSIRTLRNALITLGHRSTLIAPSLADAVPEEGVIRHSLPIRLIEGRLRDERFDLIHVFTPEHAHKDAVAMGDRLGLPVIASCLYPYEEEALSASRLPAAWTRARARRRAGERYQQAQAIVVPSAGLHRWLRACHVTRPIHEIRVGLDADEFLPSDRASVRIRFRIPAERPILLHIGRLSPWKQVDFLIRVVHRVLPTAPNLLFVIAGEGPQQERLRQLVERLNMPGNVLFQGTLSRETELMHSFAAADVLLRAPQVEAQCQVMLEALAHGVPVLTTDNDASRDISGPARGVVIAPPTEAEYAVSLLALLRDLPLRQRLSQDGRAFALEWHAEKMAARLLQVYGGLTLGRR